MHQLTGIEHTFHVEGLTFNWIRTIIIFEESLLFYFDDLKEVHLLAQNSLYFKVGLLSCLRSLLTHWLIVLLRHFMRQCIIKGLRLSRCVFIIVYFTFAIQLLWHYQVWLLHRG